MRKFKVGDSLEVLDDGGISELNVGDIVTVEIVSGEGRIIELMELENDKYDFQNDWYEYAITDKQPKELFILRGQEGDDFYFTKKEAKESSGEGDIILSVKVQKVETVSFTKTLKVIK